MPIARSSEGVDEVKSEHPDNHYATPASLAWQFITYAAGFELFHGMYFHDVGIGDYPAFGNAVTKTYGTDSVWVEGSEVRDVQGKAPYNEVISADFLSYFPHIGTMNLIGNPPFSLAKQIVMHSKRWYGTTTLLLRHAFWESADRYSSMWEDGYMPDYVFPLANRIPWWLYDTKHKGKKSTNTTQYAFFHWNWNLPRKSFAATIPFSWHLDPIIEDEYKKLYVKED